MFIYYIFFQTIVNKNNLNISVQFYLLLVSGYVKKPMKMKFQLTRILNLNIDTYIFYFD